jgi:hypothetical protein
MTAKNSKQIFKKFKFRRVVMLLHDIHTLLPQPVVHRVVILLHHIRILHLRYIHILHLNLFTVEVVTT